MVRQAQNQINFTKTALENLPVPERGQRLFFYDLKGNGLHIAVTSNAQKTFYIRRRVNGKNEKHYIGPFPDLSVEQARQKASMFAGAVAYGDNPAEQKRMMRGEYTLGELFQEYAERHLKKSRKTADESEKSFHRYFGDWEKYKLSMLSQFDVERRHNEVATKRGPYAANRALQLLRAMYNKALAWRLYQGHNPAVGLTLFEERSRERVLQADEFEKFFQALEREEDKDFRDFVMLTLFTGARKSNVLAMSWEHINLKNATWKIPAIQQKNNQTQVVVLTEVEVEILERRQELKTLPSDQYVFPGTGRTGHLTDVKRSWTSFIARAGIQDLHIHDLRRSLASWMANTGANVAVIRSALHHKDIKTTLTVYARANRDAELSARRTAHATMLALGRTGSGSQGKAPKKKKKGRL